MNRIITFTLSILLNTLLIAQQPDVTFGDQGYTNTLFTANNFDQKASCIQSDGKIVSIGENFNTLKSIMVTRHLPDGKIDSTFDADGMREISFANVAGYVYCVKQISNNSILIGGMSDGKAAFHLLNPDGSHNISFGVSGVFLESFGSGNAARVQDLIELPNGNLYAVGRASTDGIYFDFMLMKILPSGITDNAFGNMGKVVVDIGGFNDFGMDAALQSSGKIIIGGFSNNSLGVSEYAVMRFNVNGTIDSTFGVNGKWISSGGSNYNNIEALVVDSNNRIVCAGNEDNDFVVIRLTENGIPDITFGSNGKLKIDINGFQDRCFDLAFNESGFLFASGYAFDQFSVPHFCVLKVSENGAPDVNFGNNGKYVFNEWNGGSEANNIFLLDNQHLMLCGRVTENSINQYGLLKLTLPTTSIYEIDEKITMYPNPARTTITISESGFETISLINNIGQEVSLKVENNNVNISQISNGLYEVVGNKKGLKKLVGKVLIHSK